jgi:hypothetical protein
MSPSVHTRGKGGPEKAQTLTHPPTYETGAPTGEKGKKGERQKKGAAREERKKFSPSSPPVFLQNPAGRAARLPHTSVRLPRR